MIATTTETIDGYRINEYLGLVAISKDPRGFFTGVNVDKLIDMLKNEATEKYDADAVIGIRFFNMKVVQVAISWHMEQQLKLKRSSKQMSQDFFEKYIEWKNSSEYTRVLLREKKEIVKLKRFIKDFSLK